MSESPPFSERVLSLPHLGIGVSTEFGAFDAPGALDISRLRQQHPEFAGFLEIGVETAKGLDPVARAWAESGHATTYHFLDINLDEPEDFDDAWLSEVRRLAAALGPAWLCGDAGLWHFGPRERGHMLLLPPVLSDDAATAMAEGIVRLREATGFEVLPENPPGQVFIGDLHILDFFARVCERADTGMLLDAAHLGIYQRACGHDTLDGLDGFPLERVVEVHVAGGTHRDHEGYPWVDDDHGQGVLEATWEIMGTIAAGAPNLRAVVYECERNLLEECLPGFERIAQLWPGQAGTGG